MLGTYVAFTVTIQVKAKVGVPAYTSVNKEKLKAAVIFAKPENVEVKVSGGQCCWKSMLKACI